MPRHLGATTRITGLLLRYGNLCSSTLRFWALQIGRASWRGRGEISVTGVQTCALPISGKLDAATPWRHDAHHGTPPPFRQLVQLDPPVLGPADRESVVEGKRGDLGDWSSDVCSSDLG